MISYSCLISIVTGSQTLDRVQASCSPSLVGETSSTLSLQTQLKTKIPSNGYIKIVVPAETSLIQGTQSCSISQDVDVPSISCTASGRILTIKVTTSINSGLWIQVNLKSGFITPLSTAETSTFTFQTLDTDQTTVLDQLTTGITFNVDVDSLTSASITQVDNSQVGVSTKVYITINTQNVLSSGAQIQVVFPKWNSDALSSNQVPMISNPSSVSCSNKNGMSTSMSCTFDTTKDTLTIINAFPSGLNANSIVSFYISNVLNPLSFKPVTITIYTLAPSATGQVDKGTAQITATVESSISSTSLDADTFIVQEYAQIKLEFSSPVPLTSGSVITIVFPAIFNFDSQPSTVQGFGLFGVTRNLAYSINSGQRSIKITDGIQSYKDANIPGKLIFNYIKNPSYVNQITNMTDMTNSFSIIAEDSSGYRIALVQKGVYYTAQSGTVDNVAASLDSTQINLVTQMSLQFQPKHSLSSNGVIYITVPSNLQVDCNIGSSSGFSGSISCTEPTSNTLKLTNVFSSTYSYSLLNLVLSGVTLPESGQDVSGLTIKTYDVVSGTEYLVDSITITTKLFSVTPASFFSATVTTDTTQTYMQSVFTFSFTTQDHIPQNGKLKLQLPSEIAISSNSNVQSSCVSITNINSGLSCTVSSSSGINYININNAFASGQLAALKVIYFSIGGLFTPISTKTSSTFKFYSTDSSGNIIDQILSDMTVTMLNGREISTISATSDSYIVGAITKHSIWFTTLVPLKDNFQVFITIPIEIVAPNRTSISCSSQSPLQTTQPCTINGQVVTVLLATSSSVNANTNLLIKISNVKNPQSAKASSTYTALVLDDLGYTISQSRSDATATILPTQPAPITAFTFNALDLYQYAVTTITITFKNINPIPPGSYIHIKYNDIWISVYDKKTLKCTSNLVSIITCDVQSGNEFEFENLFYSTIQPQTNVSVSINNMYLAINKKMKTDSWVMTTYTAENNMIDRISDGLSFNFNCNPPCQTCPDDNPSQCTSCNPVMGKNILYMTKCYSECPAGTYNNNGVCQGCDSKCKSCASENPLYCTSCDIYSQDFPYLQGSTCTNTCAFGTYANNDTAKCESCQSPCGSCSGSAYSCLTCDQNTLFKFQHNYQCLTSCPSGFVAGDDNKCIPCDANCKECSKSPYTCTSCLNNQIISRYDNTCVDTCPFGKTVYDKKANECQMCSSQCNSCSGSVNYCTSCGKNQNLKDFTGECLSECASDKTMVEVDGECQFCNPQCKTCQVKVDSCLSCFGLKVFYNYQCLDLCPTDYTPNDNRKCVLNGLVCPFGYEVTIMGNACMLKAQICETDFVLDYSKTKCIPGPGNYTLFPLCFTCIVLSAFVLIAKAKSKQTIIVSNIIAFISLVEAVGIFMQVILAYQIGLFATFALSLISILFLYGCNFFFWILYLKQVKQDPAFKYWVQNYSKTQTFIVWVAGLFNFKFYRMFYGKFMGLSKFNAPFDDKVTFFKPFTFISFFGIVTTTLPLLIANVVGLVFIKWGYQITMTCLEMMIIEIVLLALVIYEKILLRKSVLKLQNSYKIDPKLLINDNVMSVLDDSYFNGGNNGNGYGHLTQTSINLGVRTPDEDHKVMRSKDLLEQILLKLNVSKGLNQYGDTTISFVNKLQEEEMMKAHQRMCKSFREIRESDEEFSDADSDIQNFISAPASPREKDALQNPLFMGGVKELRKTYKLRDRYDNVYAESKPSHLLTPNYNQLASVMVQTNLAELLGVEDLMLYSERQIEEMISSRSRQYTQDIEVEDDDYLDPQYASGLINNVIDGMSDSDIKKRRIRLPKNRLQEIPNFELSDIMGDFDIDDAGNAMIIRGKDGKLNDREGRKVNKRGYLIDIEGNVITKKGVFIFRKNEIDSDGEIPAPFCFEKKKESLLKIEGQQEYQKRQNKGKMLSQDTEIENEYNRLKKMNHSNRSSVESIMGETPNKYNKKNKKRKKNNEDDFIDKIVKPVNAKTKNELLRGSADDTGIDSYRDKKQTDIESQITIESKRERGRMAGNLTSLSKNNGQKFQKDDKSMNRNSTNESFFKNLSNKQGVNKGRPHLANLATGQSTIFSKGNSSIPRFADSQDKHPLQQSMESKLQQFKDALSHSKDDERLLNKLSQIEQSLYKPKKKQKLASKNLAKVYGKVKERQGDTLLNSNLQHQQSTISNYNYMSRSNLEDDEAFKIGKHSRIVDSRIKGLQTIYMNNTGGQRTGSGLSKRPATGTTTAQFRPLQHSFMESIGFNDSDQEEMRLQLEIDRMNQIVNQQKSETVSQSKLSSHLSKRAGRAIVDGGWI